MMISETRSILVAQSLEEMDQGDPIFSYEEKSLADSAAGAPLPQNAGKAQQDEFLAKRANHLISTVEPKLKGDINWLRGSTFRTRLGLLSLVAILAAALAGYLTNDLSRELGSRNLINLLAFPLIGIIAWNLLVYLFEIFAIFRKDGAVSGVAGMVTVALYPPPLNRNIEKEASAAEFRARTLFESRWRQINLSPVAARVKALLHATAFVLAAAAIAGMYLQGFSKQYAAVWESTFVQDGAQLRPILNLVLGPAVALQGGTLPPAAELDEFHAPNEKRADGAARWIHWYAITVALYVLVPRLFLMVFWLVRAINRERHLPFREIAKPYFDRIISVATGDSLAIRLVPYAHKTTENFRRSIRSHLEGHFRRPISVDWQEIIPFGEEDETSVTIPKNFQPVLLFNFASTPEKETHLELFRKLSSSLPEGNRTYQVVLDCEAFDRKAASFPDADARRSARLAAWKKLFAAENCEILVISERLPAVKVE